MDVLNIFPIWVFLCTGFQQYCITFKIIYCLDLCSGCSYKINRSSEKLKNEQQMRHYILRTDFVSKIQCFTYNSFFGVLIHLLILKHLMIDKVQEERILNGSSLPYSFISERSHKFYTFVKSPCRLEPDVVGWMVYWQQQLVRLSAQI